MRSYKICVILTFLACLFLLVPVSAEGPGQNELGARLSGNAFSGTYIRAGTPYTMRFDSDGSLSDSAGRSGRWWINDQQDYCRVWRNGPMADIETCMQVIIHNQRVAFYSGDDMLLEGELVSQ